MNEADAYTLAKHVLLEEGTNPMRVLDLCSIAMDIVGKRFEKRRVSPARARDRRSIPHARIVLDA
jgi:hypothetical protein